MERGAHQTQAKPQNSQLCSEAILLENKNFVVKYFVCVGYENSFVSSLKVFVWF